MSLADILELLSIIAFVIAGICLVLTVIFGIVFKVPTVIGDLSGRTARKSVARMRAANEKNNPNTYRPSRVNTELSKQNTKNAQSPQGRIVAQPQSQVKTNKQTLKKAEKVQADAFNFNRPDTGLLDKNKPYDYLSGETENLETENLETENLETENLETESLETESLETESLDSETTALIVDNASVAQSSVNAQQPTRIRGVKMEMIESVMLVHTDEVIWW